MEKRFSTIIMFIKVLKKNFKSLCLTSFHVQQNNISAGYYVQQVLKNYLQPCFLEKCLCTMWLKHVMVIEDCDNMTFIATSIHKVMLTKKWDIKNCTIKVSKNFTQSEKLCWIIFNWYLTNTTLNKHLLNGTWHDIFY